MEPEAVKVEARAVGVGVTAEAAEAATVAVEAMAATVEEVVSTARPLPRLALTDMDAANRQSLRTAPLDSNKRCLRRIWSKRT